MESSVVTLQRGTHRFRLPPPQAAYLQIGADAVNDALLGPKPDRLALSDDFRAEIGPLRALLKAHGYGFDELSLANGYFIQPGHHELADTPVVQVPTRNAHISLGLYHVTTSANNALVCSCLLVQCWWFVTLRRLLSGY